MLSKLLPLLNKYVPAGLALKGVQKADPKLKSFVKGSIAAGYGANEIIDFLRGKADSTAEYETLEKGRRKGSLPIQKATASDVKRGKDKAKGLQNVIAGGAALLGGAAGATIPALASLLGGEEEKEQLSSKDKKDATYKQFRERLRRKDDKMRLREDLEEEEMQALRPKKKKKKKPGLVQEETQRFQNQYGDDAKMRILQSLQQINQQLGGM